jgi:hypothetical protein
MRNLLVFESWSNETSKFVDKLISIADKLADGGEKSRDLALIVTEVAHKLDDADADAISTWISRILPLQSKIEAVMDSPRTRSPKDINPYGYDELMHLIRDVSNDIENVSLTYGVPEHIVKYVIYLISLSSLSAYDPMLWDVVKSNFEI